MLLTSRNQLSSLKGNNYRLSYLFGGFESNGPFEKCQPDGTAQIREYEVVRENMMLLTKSTMTRNQDEGGDHHRHRNGQRDYFNESQRHKTRRFGPTTIVVVVVVGIIIARIDY